jgi:hypothetical protein
VPDVAVNKGQLRVARLPGNPRCVSIPPHERLHSVQINTIPKLAVADGLFQGSTPAVIKMMMAAFSLSGSAFGCSAN